jgi:hypothetical protein
MMTETLDPMDPIATDVDQQQLADQLLAQAEEARNSSRESLVAGSSGSDCADLWEHSAVTKRIDAR